MVEDWAALEIAPWRKRRLRWSDIDEALDEAARDDPSISLFRIRGGTVSVARPHGEDQPREQLAVVAARLPLMRDFLQAVVTEHAIDCDVLLAVRLRDRGPEHRHVPLFCFHKVRFEQAILLPDLDFIISSFYAGDEFQDRLAFADKRPEAFFVGATTGGVVTMDRLRAGSHERIRAASFFRDKPGVTFEISNIVQYDDEETRAEVERLVPLSAGWRGWPEQFACRYLLSMDGNGATWSRTAVALASNSVLVKYASPSLLYYMHGLEPWVHFVPVRRDGDVLDIIANAELTLERDAAIAAAGRAFAERHFTREAVTGYMAALLREYAAAVGDQSF